MKKSLKLTERNNFILDSKDALHTQPLISNTTLNSTLSKPLNVELNFNSNNNYGNMNDKVKFNFIKTLNKTTNKIKPKFKTGEFHMNSTGSMFKKNFSSTNFDNLLNNIS